MNAFLRSFGYAWQGIRYVFKTQRNARVHAGVTLVVVVLGLWLQVSTVEWAVISATVGLVFGAEMFNTVAETVVDLLTHQFHPLAKVAKDVGAGAVLVAAVCAVGVGIAIFAPRLLARLAGG